MTPRLSIPKLKAAMERSGLSQRQLAISSGVSQPAVNQILTGKRLDPSISTVARLADALGVGIESLLD